MPSTIGGGNDAHIDFFDIRIPERGIFAVIEHAEQFHLAILHGGF